jgi:two-component system KDP operon response regulator KdpE
VLAEGNRATGARAVAGFQAPTGDCDMSAAQLRILVIDNELPIRELLRIGLKAHGFQLLEAPDGKTSLQLLSQDPDPVILELALPDIDGLDLLRTIRGRNEDVPVIVLSNCGDEAVKIQALDQGANDYITKPFSMEELVARIRVAVRRQTHVAAERPIFRTGDLSVDLIHHVVKVADREAMLSPEEYDLLRIMVQHAGKVLTHRFLLTEL